MGWEHRGTNQYYYKKERQGSQVKSVYVGRGEIAHMVAQIQSTSPLLERVARTMKSPEALRAGRIEAAFQEATELIRLITEASLLSAGYHTHRRQWRKKRDVRTG
jgi:hypothetical protein